MTTRDDLVSRLQTSARFIEQWSNTSSPERHKAIEAEAVELLPHILSAASALDAEIAEWKEYARKEDERLQEWQSRALTAERQLAEETGRCARAAIYNLENCGSMIFVQEHGWSGLKERVAAAIRGGAK